MGRGPPTAEDQSRPWSVGQDCRLEVGSQPASRGLGTATLCVKAEHSAVGGIDEAAVSLLTVPPARRASPEVPPHPRPRWRRGTGVSDGTPLLVMGLTGSTSRQQRWPEHRAKHWVEWREPSGDVAGACPAENICERCRILIRAFGALLGLGPARLPRALPLSLFALFRVCFSGRSDSPAPFPCVVSTHVAPSWRAGGPAAPSPYSGPLVGILPSCLFFQESRGRLSGSVG